MTTQIYYPVSENGPLSWNWVTLSGPDAKDFLHRLTTVNLRHLNPGDGAPGCFLTAQGKIRSYFHLWSPSKDQYAFEFDAGRSGKWKTDLLALIDQYTFGEKFTLEDLTPRLKCAWIFPDEGQMGQLGIPPLSEPQLGQMIQASLADGTALDMKICNHGTTSYGRIWLTVWGPTESVEKWISKNCPTGQRVLSFTDLENWRIQAVQPKMDSEITESAVPLEIGLRTAIADNKGCYPGQEVIEKIVALGAPAKRLVRIEGVGPPPQVGDRVQAIDPVNLPVRTEIGVVTTTSKPGPNMKFAALAILRKTHAREGIEIGFLNQPQLRGTVVQLAEKVNSS